jgi:hypothetical protein
MSYNEYMGTNKKGSILIVALLVATLILVVAGAWYFGYKKISSAAPSIMSNEPTSGTTPTSNNEMLLKQTTTYKNSVLQFSIVMPAGWYVPDNDATSGIFYDCPYINCPNQFEISQAATLLYNIYGDYYHSILEAGKEEVAGGQLKNQSELPNLVPGAGVIKSINNSDPSSWQNFNYTVIFHEGSDSFIPFYIQSKTDSIERQVLSSLRPM